MKRCDVPRDLSGHTGKKLRQAAQLCVAVVEARHEQCHDFNPDTAGVKPSDRIEDWLEPASELTIPTVIKALEIDLEEIEVLVKLREVLRLSEAYFVTVLALKITEQAKNGTLSVTFNDREKTPESVLEEIKSETKEELEEVA